MFHSLWVGFPIHILVPTFIQVLNGKGKVMNTEKKIAKATELGAEHGKNAASWYFDGNTSIESYRRVLKGIDDGDPEILDTFPTDNLSGEWADGYDTRDLERDLGLNSFSDVLLIDECATAYMNAFSQAVTDEIERVARYQADPDPNWLYIKDCEGY